jgi:hypothetical protein
MFIIDTLFNWYVVHFPIGFTVGRIIILLVYADYIYQLTIIELNISDTWLT